MINLTEKTTQDLKLLLDAKNTANKQLDLYLTAVVAALDVPKDFILNKELTAFELKSEVKDGSV